MPSPAESGRPPGERLTQALSQAAAGSPEAQEQVARLVYDELKRLARIKLSGQASGHTLQPTAVVHEAWMRLLGGQQAQWQDSSHFFCAAAAAMRSILVDHARRKRAARRGGDALRLTMNEELAGGEDLSTRVVEVHEALEQLSELDERKGQTVELLFFAGLSVAEAARVLGVSERTVKRDWRYCRAWLFRRIGGP
jgi:RNA polymerase sigma factor (TIGR02999 family)